MKPPKLLKFVLIVIVVCINTALLQAQTKTKKDTLYYLLNIKQIPVNDRMIYVYTEQNHKFYVINCRCSKTNNNPVFHGDTTKRSIINKVDFEKIKLENLPDLIEKAKKYSVNEFSIKYDFFILEPYKRGFIISKALMMNDHREPAIDFNVIHPDTTKHKKP